MTGGEQGLEVETIMFWLPPRDPLRVLEIGCGAGEGLGQLLESGRVLEFVGVDLDETAIEEARARWPQATFLCADAARLPASFVGRFDVALLRRPDLLAQPQRWREVFDRLPVWLRPGGRAIVAVMGQAEASLASRWLGEGGLQVIHRGEQGGLPLRVFVAEAPFPVLWDNSGEGMACDARTGDCLR